uniref:uncharacterized protein LOC130488489 n=1 Tax=Euleptes europaea TaxID=460621 RepID=UPI0025412BAA|nr:uncharacterized protein LOC130488489 [Euleptes europaea]
MMLITLLVMTLAALIESSSNYRCYGDITTFDTPVITCGNVGYMTNCGVPAVERAVKINLSALKRYRTQIVDVGKKLCVDPAILGAMICLDSGAGTRLRNGWNKDQTRFGLMQIDSRNYPVVGAWDSTENILQGGTILRTYVTTLQNRRPGLTWQRYWRGGICAYQAGIPSILSYQGRDFCGTYGRYADEVMVAANTEEDQKRQAAMAGVSFAVVFLFCLLYRTEGNVPGCTGNYGKIMDVQTTGAGLRTATAEGLKSGGTQSSGIIAERDLKNMNKYKAKILDVSKKTGIEAAVIAGIISRESHAGAVLKNGWGDGGNGFGLMQVDKRFHKLIGTWDSADHMTQGTQILCGMINGVAKKFPRWTKAQQLKGGISAYNAGLRNVQTYDGMDVGTTGNDYANDVAARAQFYKRNGY